MIFGRKKPSEYELQRSVLRAATIAKAKEIETSELSTQNEIDLFSKLAFGEFKRKPSASQLNLAKMSVNSLLTEGKFIKEIVEFMVQNPKTNMPSNTKERMIAVIEQVVHDFQENK